MPTSHDVNGGRPLRIFLLTPYSGANLGDQAIQQSFVANLADRCRSAEFIGITLNPRATAALHGISCFPLSAAVADRHGGARLQFPQVVSPDSAATPLIHPLKAAAEILPRSPPGQTNDVVAAGVRGFRLAQAPLSALRRGLRSLLRVPRELAFTLRAARLLGKGDLLVVAGGGQLDEEWGGPWNHPFALWRWTALARLRGCRIAIASVGWGRLHSDIGRRLAAGALGRADYCSYRDAGSAANAAAIGSIHREDLVPDIALALPVPADRMHGAHRPVTRVGISPIAFARQGTWPVANTEVYTRYLQELAAFVSSITSRGLRVLLYTTGGMDRAAVAELVTRVLELPATRPDLIEVADTSTVNRLLDALAMCDLVVASRLHGVILAHRLALPTLAISFDRKVQAHMSDVAQPEFCLDILRFNRDDLLASFDELARRVPQVSVQLREFLGRVEQPLAQQFDQLARLAGIPPHDAG
jgi:polysaccharide pyruvyl transferase WcaK-like protein